MFDWLVIGAGFAGSVLAERLARVRNERVLVVDRRNHIGGDAFDHYDEAGVLIHRYGPHVFHTDAQPIVDHLSQFTEWRPYEHRELAEADGRLVPFPINRTTLDALYGLSLDSDEAVEAFFRSKAEPRAEIRTCEDVLVSRIGRELYETFFRGPLRGRWGVDPSRLDKAFAADIPIRTDANDRRFDHAFQAMPKHGYARMFERMLDHPNIKIMLQTDYAEVRRGISFKRMIFTGSIDEFFDHRFGKLPYASLRYEHRTLDTPRFQPVAIVERPQGETPSRIIEYKHITGQDHPRTTIAYEHPSADGEPCRPIPTPENAALFKRYEQLARATPNVWFVGRLADYRYYDMDEVVGQALATFGKIDAALGTGAKRARAVMQAS